MVAVEQLDFWSPAQALEPVPVEVANVMEGCAHMAHVSYGSACVSIHDAQPGLLGYARRHGHRQDLGENPWPCVVWSLMFHGVEVNVFDRG
jgi:hypothetical protein